MERQMPVFLPSPDSPVEQVHLDYLENGADIIITASYQATIQGFKAKGYSDEESEALLKRSAEIAFEAREVYDKNCAGCCSGDGEDDGRILKQRPILVAALVGSYGAYLADGSGYSGDYGHAITVEIRRRVQILADSSADLLAFETVPNKLEAEAFAQLLEEEDIKIPAWFSFNSVTTKPIVIYPNSGETYDADLKEWVQNTGVTDEDFISYVNKWGSISISMSLHQTSFCFICSHLTSGQKDGDELRRNSDVMEILRKTRFPPVHDIGDEYSPQTILEHECDRILWYGRGLHQLSYVRGESRFSDHRPVYSMFLAEVESVSCNQIKKSASSRIEVVELFPHSHCYSYTDMNYF
ncbi:Selenocysteine methyltransferase [Glycine soja]|nr:Selenocysteine methyltransferase [Glycine soja]